MIGQEKHEFEQLCIWNPPDYQINKLKKLIPENSMKFWGMRRRRLSREMSLSSRRGGCIRCSLKESFLPVTFEKVIFCYHIKQNSDITGLSLRAWDWGLLTSYYERGPWLVP